MHIHIDKQAEEYINSNKVCIISMWHSRIFVFPKFLQNRIHFSAVVSSHGDGEILSRIMNSYGYHIIRGSSRHKSFSAMSGMIRSIKAGVNIGITPDGPIGPRYKIKGNISEFANRFSLPILPVCYSATNAKVLRTWDRFIIPIPLLSEIFIEIGEPIIPNTPRTEGKELEKIMCKQMKALDKKTGIIIEY